MPARLLYVTCKSVAPNQAGHTHVQAVVDAWRRQGVSVRLLAPRPGRSRWVGLPLLHLHVLWTLLTWECRAVYVRSHPLAWPAVVLARLLGRTVVVECNGVALELFAVHGRLVRWYPLIRHFDRAGMRLADAVVAVTARLREFLIWHDRLAGSRISVVGNGADPERFHPGAVPVMDLPDAYAVFIGELQRWQGLDTVLAAWRDAPAHWPVLVIAGNGVMAPAVQMAVAEGRVRWLGQVPHGSVPGLVARARFALAPMGATVRNRAIGVSPIKVFEYLAAGCPVVASDLPGLSAIVRAAGAGDVFRAGDAADLRRAVERQLATPRAIAGDRGRRWLVERASWDRRAMALRVVIAACAAGRLPAASVSDP